MHFISQKPERHQFFQRIKAQFFVEEVRDPKLKAVFIIKKTHILLHVIMNSNKSSVLKQVHWISGTVPAN